MSIKKQSQQNYNIREINYIKKKTKQQNNKTKLI